MITKFTNGDILVKNSPEMRARRLKRVRNLANLSREQMCEDSEINRYTLIGWENARFGGLTSNGAVKIINKVFEAGVHCTVDWLMEGDGPEPSVNPMPLILDHDQFELCEDTSIAYELAFFKSKNKNTADLVVKDDVMAPQFQEGDVVAGKKRAGKDILMTIGYDCIVETAAGEKLLRNIQEGQNQHTFTLICNNPAIKKRTSVIADAKLNYSAPVIWHRKKDIRKT